MKADHKTLKIIAIAAFTLVIAIAYTATRVYQHLTQTDPKVAAAAGTPLPVGTKIAERGEVNQIIGAEAVAGESQLVPIRTSLKTVRATNIAVNLGDVVHKGDLLIEFDNDLQNVALESAKAQLNSYRKQLSLTQENVRNLENLYKRNLISVTEMLKATSDESELTAKVAALELQLNQAKEDLKATKIRSPVSGIVTERTLNPGTVANQGMDFIKLSTIDPIHITAKLSEDKIPYLFLNQEAELFFYAFPNRSFKGQIAIINPSIEEKSGLISVIIRVDNPTLELKPGMNGNIRLNSTYQALRIPSIALISAKNSSAYVFVVDDSNVAHLRQVTTGASSNGLVTIESGLEEGEKVVVVGQASLADNMRVQTDTNQTVISKAQP